MRPFLTVINVCRYLALSSGAPAGTIFYVENRARWHAVREGLRLAKAERTLWEYKYLKEAREQHSFEGLKSLEVVGLGMRPRVVRVLGLINFQDGRMVPAQASGAYLIGLVCTARRLCARLGVSLDAPEHGVGAKVTLR